ncbi:MAG: hypothetical protein OSB76_08790 [Alphaproteobacteria bacterium]|jgi:hypothetical protein|nr:hypothetical protein [Alphaproteobacteria bacterium]|tara:strand:+ start:1093 stop:1236 length:144 start_codon:yes stop_codon:yes gene_type:complete
MMTVEKKPDDLQRKQRSRNIALAVAIFALAGLFYALTIVRMSGGSGS